MPSDRTRKRERDRETEGAKRGKASQKGDLGGNRRATVVGCERPARDSPDVATHHLLQKVLDKICQVSRVVWILVVRLLRERRAPVKETTGDKSDARGVSDHLRALSRQRTRHPTRFPLGAKLKGILLTPTQRVRIRARLSRAAEGSGGKPGSFAAPTSISTSLTIPTPSRACFACLSSSLPLRVWPRDRDHF